MPRGMYGREYDRARRKRVAARAEILKNKYGLTDEEANRAAWQLEKLAEEERRQRNRATKAE